MKLFNGLRGRFVWNLNCWYDIYYRQFLKPWSSIRRNINLM